MTRLLDHKTYQQTLPKKRISAGCLFFDAAGNLLVVNPTYKQDWEIPGGVVEADESPRETVMREVREELGLARAPLRLLGVDYSGQTDRRTESLQFIFLGGVLSADEIARIRLPAAELSEYRFLAPEEALALLSKRLRRRLRCCLANLDRPGALYMEEQAVV